MNRPPPRTKMLSVVQEGKVAKAFGGRVTPASGALRDPLHKGDVSAKHFLVECKVTETKGYRLTPEILTKIEREALRNNKMPLLQVDVGGQAYAVVRLQDFLEIARDGNYL